MDVYLAVLGDGANSKALELVQAIRRQGFTAERDYLGRKIKAQFKAADTFKAKLIITLGESEVEAEKAVIKNNRSRQELKASFEDIMTNFESLSDQLLS